MVSAFDSESFLWNADIPSGEPTAAYCAHLESIRSHLTIEDYSRVDAMNASGFAPTATAWRVWKKPPEPVPRLFGKSKPGGTGSGMPRERRIMSSVLPETGTWSGMGGIESYGEKLRVGRVGNVPRVRMQ